MPDLQKHILRYARTMQFDNGGHPQSIMAVPVEYLPLLLDEVAKAAAAETMEAVMQERRASERLCESCEERLAELAVEFSVWHEERGHTVSLELCARCHAENWSRLKALPVPARQGDAT